MHNVDTNPSESQLFIHTLNNALRYLRDLDGVEGDIVVEPVHAAVLIVDAFCNSNTSYVTVHVPIIDQHDALAALKPIRHLARERHTVNHDEFYSGHYRSHALEIGSSIIATLFNHGEVLQHAYNHRDKLAMYLNYKDPCGAAAVFILRALQGMATGTRATKTTRNDVACQVLTDAFFNCCDHEYKGARHDWKIE